MYVDFDSALFSFKELTGRFEKIFLIPVKENRIINKPKIYYVRELLYYFHRLGYESPPFHYVLFENGEYFSVFKDFTKKSYFIPGVNSINIFLIYNNNFSIFNFRVGLLNLLSSELSNLIVVSDIDNNEDIILYYCDKFLKNNVNCQNYPLNKNDINFFEPYLKASKVKPNIKFFISVNNLLFEPGIISEIPITIQNESNYYMFWGDNYFLEIRTQNNSNFFVNDLWLTPRTIRILNVGSIQPKGTMVVYIKLKMPLLPNNYKEKLLFFINSELVGESELNIRVNDLGQKIIRLNNNNVGMINVYENPNFNSNTIARVPSRSEYIFYEKKGDFYKIKVQGEYGWVHKSNVQIIRE